MIAIKGMEILPRSCMNCDMFQMVEGGYGKCRCYLTQTYVNYSDEYLKKRADDCPLVEIEPLSDEEKRIFLSAMGKERVICKQIDIDKVDDGSIKKLVPIVNTIERKIKKVLWN